MTLEHVRYRLQPLGEVRDVEGCVVHEDERDDAIAQRVRIDDSTVALDHATRLELLDALMRRSLRQSDPLGELAIRGLTVLLQNLDDLPIDRVHRLRYRIFTTYYLP